MSDRMAFECLKLAREAVAREAELREALEAISNYTEGQVFGEYADQGMRRIARAALADLRKDGLSEGRPGGPGLNRGFDSHSPLAESADLRKDATKEESDEFCHSRSGDERGAWCGDPAEFIIWGKLFPPDALGPRCYDCAVRDLSEGRQDGFAHTMLQEIGGPRSPAIYAIPMR